MASGQTVSTENIELEVTNGHGAGETPQSKTEAMSNPFGLSRQHKAADDIVVKTQNSFTYS